MLVVSDSASERRAYWASLAAVVVLHLGILWIPAYNALVDFPFHLGRAWVLYTYDRTPFFQATFARVLDPMPNLAIDLIVPPLLYVLPPIVAGKVFLSSIVLLFALGCHLLAVTVYGRPSWAAPLAAFAVTNSAFLYGFVNSAFSTALFLVAFAVWLRLRPKWTAASWLAVAALATATYIAHLSGFVFLGLAMGVCWLLSLPQSRRIRISDLLDFSVLLPALLIQAYPWANRVRIAGNIDWGSFFKKVLGVGSVFIGFHYVLSVCTIVLFVAAFAIAAARGKPRIERLFFWLGAAFAVAAIACPSRLTAGGGAEADTRFFPPAFVFFVLSFTAVKRPAVTRLALPLAFAAMLLRLGDVGWTLARNGASAEQQVAALAKAAPDSRIYEFYVSPAGYQAKKLTRGNLNLSCYSLFLTQSVTSVFFAVRGVQPIYFRDPNWPLPWLAPSLAYLDAHSQMFDYVWGCNLGKTERDYLERKATLVSTGDACELWKLKK